MTYVREAKLIQEQKNLALAVLQKTPRIFRKRSSGEINETFASKVAHLKLVSNRYQQGGALEAVHFYVLEADPIINSDQNYLLRGFLHFTRYTFPWVATADLDELLARGSFGATPFNVNTAFAPTLWRFLLEDIRQPRTAGGGS